VSVLLTPVNAPDVSVVFFSEFDASFNVVNAGSVVGLAELDKLRFFILLEYELSVDNWVMGAENEDKLNESYTFPSMVSVVRVADDLETSDGIPAEKRL
jgi:hypothetical protein